MKNKDDERFFKPITPPDDWNPSTEEIVVSTSESILKTYEEQLSQAFLLLIKTLFNYALFRLGNSFTGRTSSTGPG